MVVSLDESNIGVEIYEVSGDTPNYAKDGEKISLLELSDALPTDGDYYYVCEEDFVEAGFCGVIVHVCAFGAGESKGYDVLFDNWENDKVGVIKFIAYVDCLDEIIDYLENR